MALIKLGGSFLVNLQDNEVHILMPKFIKVSLEVISCVSGWPSLKVVSILASDITSSSIEQSHQSQWHLCLLEYSC